MDLVLKSALTYNLYSSNDCHLVTIKSGGAARTDCDDNQSQRISFRLPYLSIHETDPERECETLNGTV